MQIFIGDKTLSHFFKLAQSLKRIFTNYSITYTCTLFVPIDLQVIVELKKKKKGLD